MLRRRKLEEQTDRLNTVEKLLAINRLDFQSIDMNDDFSDRHVQSTYIRLAKSADEKEKLQDQVIMLQASAMRIMKPHRRLQELFFKLQSKVFRLSIKTYLVHHKVEGLVPPLYGTSSGKHEIKLYTTKRVFQQCSHQPIRYTRTREWPAVLTDYICQTESGKASSLTPWMDSLY